MHTQGGEDAQIIGGSAVEEVREENADDATVSTETDGE